MVKYYCIIFKSKCALWVNETTGKLFKLVFYVQLYLKRPPQITLLYLKKKVKRKATILCVFIVYSITKKNSKVKKKRTIR